MTNIYGEYNKHWKNIKKIIDSNISNFNVHKINLEEIKKINKVIYNGKILNTTNKNDIEKYFIESRKYIIDNIKDNNYDLIIELGSGWGRNIFHIINELNSDINIISGEYTEQGILCQKFINENYYKYKNLEIYNFDYNNSNSFFSKINFNNYKNILLLSFWSIEQITYLNNTFFDNILNLKGKCNIISIEPIGWQIDEKKSLMKENKIGYRNYYNKNYFIKLQELETQKKIIFKNIILNYFNYNVLESIGSLVHYKII